jgi:hypothetical protein
MKQISFLAFAVFALTVETVWAQPNNPASWRILTNPASWKILTEGRAVAFLAPPVEELDGSNHLVMMFALDTNAPAGQGAGAKSLKLEVKQTGEYIGIVCADMGKMKLAAGQWYDFSFNARTAPPKTFALVVSLESLDGKEVLARTTLPEVGGDQWGHFSVALHVRQPAMNCRLVIALADTGTLWLNDLSIVLRDAAVTH